eukprot:11021533-Heterocapsa_arctica.AAC.1
MGLLHYQAATQDIRCDEDYGDFFQRYHGQNAMRLLQQLFRIELEEACRPHTGMVAGDENHRELSRRTLQRMLENA